jgi:hypothetical protein
MTAKADFSHHQNVPSRTLSSAIVMPDTARPVSPHPFVKRYRTEIAASSSSVFSTLAAFPLDSVKTRMQTYQYNGFLDCVRHTYRTEKLGGFFRGKPFPVPGPSLCRSPLLHQSNAPNPSMHPSTAVPIFPIYPYRLGSE